MQDLPTNEFASRMSDLKYRRYLSIRQSEIKNRLKQRRMAWLSEENSNKDAIETNLCIELSKAPSQLSNKLQSINKLIKDGHCGILQQIHNQTDQMCEQLRVGGLSDLMHLCEILAELIYSYPQDARALVTSTSSLVIMKAFSEIGSKPMYKMDIQNCLLFYCRAACQYLDCIGQHEMVCLSSIMREILVMHDPQWNRPDELQLCINTLNTIFTQKDDVTNLVGLDDQLRRRLEIKYLKNMCFKECLMQDKRSFLTLVCSLHESDDILRLLVHLSLLMNTKEYIKIFLTQFDMSSPLKHILQQSNNQYNQVTKDMAVKLINNIIQMSASVGEGPNHELFKFVLLSTKMDHSHLSYEMIEVVANYVLTFSKQQEFSWFLSQQGLTLFEYVLENTGMVRPEIQCAVLEACRSILYFLWSELWPFKHPFSKLLELASGIYYHTGNPNISKQCTQLLEQARSHSCFQ